MDLRGRHAPALQVRADAQANEELGAAAGQRLDGVHVEMVEVVVRDHDRIDVLQVPQRQWRRVQARRADELER